MDDLKPCPFCGGAMIATPHHDFRHPIDITSDDEKLCPLNGKAFTHVDRTAWNTRAAPQVKPLVWVTPSPTTDGQWQDESGIYDIEDCILFIGYVETGIRFDTEEAAKAAAQAHYEAMIREALA